MKHTLLILLASLTVSVPAMADLHATGSNADAMIWKSCYIDITTGKDGIAVVTARDSQNTYNFWMLSEALLNVKSGPLWFLENVGVIERTEKAVVYGNTSSDAGHARLMLNRGHDGRLESFELEHTNSRGKTENTIHCIRLRNR